MEVDKICRTCLSLNGPLLSIYDGSAGAGCVADMLRSFIKYKPKRSDNLPEKVCLACISEINHCYSFQMKCENSIRTLKQLLPDAMAEEETDASESGPIVEKTDKSVQTEAEKRKSLVKSKVSSTSKQIQTESEKQVDVCSRASSPIVMEEEVAEPVVSSRRQYVKNELQEEEFVSSPKRRKIQPSEQQDKDEDIQEADENDQIILEIAHVDSDGNEQLTYVHDDDLEQVVLETNDGEEQATTYYELATNEQYTEVMEDGDEELLHLVYSETEGEQDYNFTICSNDNGEEEIVAKQVKRKDPKDKKRRKEAPVEARSTPTDWQEQLDTTAKEVRSENRIVTVVKTNSPEKLSMQLTYFCENCNAGFASIKGLKTHHKLNVCNSVSFKCDSCERVFISESLLDEHKVTHLMANSCNECKSVFKTQDELSNHMIVVHKRNPRYKCPECKRVFSMLSALKDHVRTHSGEKPYVCQICSKAFSQNANLRQHIMRHSQNKKFKCEQCDKAFVTKAELASHQRIHTGAQPFKCEFCPSSFSTSSSLLKHKRRHTGERPYACEFCLMRFMSLNVLKNHRRIHTGEKPYQCQHCEKTFAQRGDCVIHQRMHTGEKHYTCHCGATFVHPTSLNSHKRNHHKDEDPNQNQRGAGNKTGVKTRNGRRSTGKGAATAVEEESVPEEEETVME